MDRVFKSGASGTPPTPPASPSVGYPIGGDPGTGTPATKPGPYWYHMITESLRRLLVASGLTPDHTNLDQVTLAVQELIRQAAGDYKASVRVATTANITALNGGAPNTLDGVTLVAGDRILVKDQTTASQNGLYVVTTLGTGANGTWSRAGDADAAGELTSGAVVSVEEGAANADTRWMLITNDPVVLGTTALTFTRQGSAGTSSGLQPLTATAAAGVMTITLGPTSLDFRDVTPTTGGGINVANGAPITLVVPATTNFGLATANGTQRLPVLAMNNGLSMELALGTLMGGVNFDETTLLTTVAIGAATTLASVGSTTARANLAHKVVGFVDALFTTGTGWTISRVQPAGGQALGALSSYGYGQSWKTAAFSPGTTYYNGPKPIEVAVNSNLTATGGAVTFSIAGPSGPVSVVAGMLINTAGGSYNGGATCTIPANCAWSFSIPGSFVGSQVMN